ncbi:hypothetical protein JIN85_18585 [Luteolibacter pohnpeiensis]|uniref:Transposase n=1 Tax=Luteolibacter pohnpeiensis TaxID=454153 RepID=A0A934SBF6_9BACT|nr:hypothetical protein [Luteolibacter pohnpeiensis]MBK1884431.1 hypothetical protein [Luteolibacter pohnpeiensis]
MTTTKEDTGKLIRMDAIGRVRTSASQREALLDAYESSGLSGPEFAARHGVKYQTFATWLQKRKRRTGGYPAMAAPAGGAFPLLLAEVECAEGPAGSTIPLEVRLPEQRGSDAAWEHAYGDPRSRAKYVKRGSRQTPGYHGGHIRQKVVVAFNW